MSAADDAFLYPRRLNITRVPALGPAAGNVGRRDKSQSNEEPVDGLQNLAANIYEVTRGPAPPTHLPADLIWRDVCKILIDPKTVGAGAAVQRNDIATDDEGNRWLLMTPTSKSGMGIQVRAERADP